MKCIVCLGDSITHGRGEQPNVSWVGRIKEKFEKKDFHHIVYNLRVIGDTSSDLVKRIDTELKKRVKYLRNEDEYKIIIAIGINDIRRTINKNSVETTKVHFQNNIRKIMQIARKHSDKLIIVGITPVDEKRTKPFENAYMSNKNIIDYNKILKVLAKKEKVLFIDIFKEFNKINYFKLLADGIHPNKKGYDLMFKIISKKLMLKG